LKKIQVRKEGPVFLLISERPHCFGVVPAIIIVSEGSELSPKPCHPPFTPATSAIEFIKQKMLKIAAFLTKPTPIPDTKKGQPEGWPL